MCFTYIIYSPSLDTYYIGACQQDLLERLNNHNIAKYGSNHFTARASDWEIFFSFQTNSYDHAIRIERKLKSMKSRIYLENLKKYPDLVDKIWNENFNT